MDRQGRAVHASRQSITQGFAPRIFQIRNARESASPGNNAKPRRRIANVVKEGDKVAKNSNYIDMKAVPVVYLLK
jgi:hypothetical protein